MNPDEVARYLRSNPSFFERYSELLSQIYVAHPHGGRAIPLSERQVVTLRDRNRALEGKLSELIQFGEENDSIGEKVHRLSVALLSAKELDTALDVLYSGLHDDFSVPHVGVRLWRGQGDRAEFAAVSQPLREYTASLTQPFCGPNTGFEAATWFAVSSEHVRSVSLVPLRDAGGTLGVLSLASEDAQRFYPEMGTLYLSRIGELVAATLARLL
jgi:hypothetical protein